MKYDKILCRISITDTAQKMKFSIRDFFSKCDQIRMKLRIWPHFLKKILDAALHFLCSVKVMYISGYLIRSIMLNNMTFDIYLSYV